MSGEVPQDVTMLVSHECFTNCTHVFSLTRTTTMHILVELLILFIDGSMIDTRTSKSWIEYFEDVHDLSEHPTRVRWPSEWMMHLSQAFVTLRSAYYEKALQLWHKRKKSWTSQIRSYIWQLVTGNNKQSPENITVNHQCYTTSLTASALIEALAWAC
jgi:hypothetical protein